MVYRLLKKGLFSALWGILKGRFRQDYLDKLEEEAQKTSVYNELKSNLYKAESDRKLLNLQLTCQNKTSESWIREIRKQRESYQRQIASRDSVIRDYQSRLARRDGILEKSRVDLLASIAQGIIDSKKMRGLEDLTSHQRARINRDKNDIPQIFVSIFEKPPYRKISFILVHNQGKVYYQNAASRKQVGDLKGRNLSGYLDCANPNKQKVVLGGKDYTSYVFPLSGGRAFDYSAVFFKPASVFERLKYKSARQMDRAIKVVQAEMAALDAKLDEKAQIAALDTKLDKKARHHHHDS